MTRPNGQSVKLSTRDWIWLMVLAAGTVGSVLGMNARQSSEFNASITQILIQQATLTEAQKAISDRLERLENGGSP